jgi:hypothetical protein
MHIYHRLGRIVISLEWGKPISKARGDSERGSARIRCFSSTQNLVGQHQAEGFDIFVEDSDRAGIPKVCQVSENQANVTARSNEEEAQSPKQKVVVHDTDPDTPFPTKEQTSARTPPWSAPAAARSSRRAMGVLQRPVGAATRPAQHTVVGRTQLDYLHMNHDLMLSIADP